MEIKVKKLTDDATIPTRGSEAAAGSDLYAAEGCMIPAGETRLVHTGIAVSIPVGYFGAIYARSGLAVKQGLRPANCVGVVDADYRGEVMVGLHNDSKEEKTIEKGMRIAQLVIQPCLKAEFSVTDGLDHTQRGEGGFGSTGK